MILVIFCSFHSWCYDNKPAILRAVQALKNIANCKLETVSTNNIPSIATIYNPPPAETNSKFFEKKSLLIGAGHMTLFALSALGFLLPANTVKRNARQNADLLNSGLGRICVFLSQLSLRLFYLNVFPAMIILSHSKMKRTLWRHIKNVFIILQRRQNS
jgi:hypothetical protein